jgi:hypothetical protein
MPGRVERAGVRLEVGPPLGVEGQGEHLPGGQPAQLVEIKRRGVGWFGRRIVDYPEHGVLLPAGATRRSEIDYSGGYAASMSGMLIHNIWL